MSKLTHLARWESIANGAVRCEVLGLEGLLALRVARVNIGLLHTTGWRSSEHLSEHRYTCSYTGNWRADKQIFWLLRRVRSHPPDLRSTSLLAHSQQHDRIKPNHRMDYEMIERVFEDEIPADKIKIYFGLVRSEADNPLGYVIPGTS
jgi:hypothetical protein